MRGEGDIVQVRAVLSKGLAAGLRNDAPESALAMRQRWRLAEGRSEDYAFLLLSQVTNALQAQVSDHPLPVLLLRPNLKSRWHGGVGETEWMLGGA